MRTWVLLFGASSEEMNFNKIIMLKVNPNIFNNLKQN